MKYLGFIVTSQNFIHMQSAAYVYCLVTICIDTFEVIWLNTSLENKLFFSPRRWKSCMLYAHYFH